MDMHPGQLSVTSDQVRMLLADQFPGWAGLVVRAVASAGTVNALYRLGDELVARFPLLGDDPATVQRSLEDEAQASAELAAGTTVPTPVPVALGRPGHGYPLPWAVQSWLPGVDANTRDPGGSEAFARDIAHFIIEVRSIDTRGRRFAGRGRGGDLTGQDHWVRTCLDNSSGLVDVPALSKLWQELRTLPPSGPDVMSHTDLIPGNVLVADGRLAGVLDGGGFQAADPSLDLVAAWHLLDVAPRRVLREILGCSSLEWERGRAWALAQAIGAGWYYSDTNPAMSRMGVRTLERLLAHA